MEWSFLFSIQAVEGDKNAKARNCLRTDECFGESGMAAVAAVAAHSILRRLYEMIIFSGLCS